MLTHLYISVILKNVLSYTIDLKMGKDPQVLQAVNYGLK